MQRLEVCVVSLICVKERLR